MIGIRLTFTSSAWAASCIVPSVILRRTKRPSLPPGGFCYRPAKQLVVHLHIVCMTVAGPARSLQSCWTCPQVAKLARQEAGGHMRLLILHDACIGRLQDTQGTHLAEALKGFSQPALSVLPPHTRNTRTSQDTARQPASVLPCPQRSVQPGTQRSLQPCTQPSRFLTPTCSGTCSVRHMLCQARPRSLSQHAHALCHTHALCTASVALLATILCFEVTELSEPPTHCAD